MISPSDFYKDDIKRMYKALLIDNLNIDEEDLKRILESKIDEVDYERILESKIDESMKYHHGNKVYEEARIYTNVPIYFINKIATKYLTAGWTYIYVTIIDSSITSFKFSDTEIVGLIDPHILYTARTVKPILKGNIGGQII